VLKAETRTLCAAVVILLATTACTRAPQAPPAPRHFVLVTIDTLRADRLGCYGSRDVATPRLDALARAGALAPEASVHVPLTRPSHACLLTGRLPAEHGLRDNVSPPLDARVPTLGESLRGAGFRTAAFVSSIVLSSQSGLGRGFDAYGDRFEAGGDDARFLNSIQKRGDATTAEAIAWLESQRDARVFLWLHLYDPHDPYDPPEPYAGRYADRPYDGEVAWSDELIGRLDDALARLGLRDDTLLVVTSDHGEGLGEHGESVHGFFAYQTTLRVPFLARGPGIAAGTRIPVTVRSVDVMPTALELLGVATPAGLSGRSLAAALRGGPAPAEAPTYAESLLPLLHYGWSDLRVLREGRWKYIQAPRPELYDLKNDPRELSDLAAAEPARAAALREALASRLAAEKRDATTSAAQAGESVPPDLLERLGALGYLGAGAPEAGASTGADPKDKIVEFKLLNRLVREGLLRLRAKDYAGSAERLGELLRRGVDSFEAHYYLARALVGLKRWSEAERHFRAAAEKLPGFGPAHLGAADCRLARGDLPGALGALQAGRKASPKDARVAEREAQVLRRLGRRDEAARAYAAAAALAPKDALLKVQLGEALRDLGRLDEAAAALREAVTLDPAPASYWNSLGMVLGAKNDMAEAERAFREATKRDANDAQYAYNLGLALLRQGRSEEAATWFRKALELRPQFQDARARLAETRAR
jgi:arylsulfatase A-like enzyme/Tfp pilus assembly protein PilF